MGKTLALVDPALAVPALITILHELTPRAVLTHGAGDFHERYLVAESLLAVAFSQGVPRQAQMGMPFLLAQRQHVEVFHRQARQVSREASMEVEATLEAASALLAAAFSQEHPLHAAPLARPGAPALTQEQRAVLGALVEDDVFWSREGNSDLKARMERKEWHTLLTGYGLPASRDTLRHLIELRGLPQRNCWPPRLPRGSIGCSRHW